MHISGHFWGTPFPQVTWLRLSCNGYAAQFQLHRETLWRTVYAPSVPHRPYSSIKCDMLELLGPNWDLSRGPPNHAAPYSTRGIVGAYTVQY